MVNLAKASGGKSRVSVCIPSYNASKFIGETIKSVLDSTYSNLEVIVNDDASTDNTRGIVESFDDERIRFFQNERNQGVPKNWNRALGNASGDYVGLLNHDDLYGPFWLTFAVHNLEKHPHVGWVTTACRIIDHEGQTIGIVRRLPETREYNRSEAFLCIGKMGAMLPVYIARREILEEVGYYDEDDGPYADHGLHLRLASRYSMYYSTNPLLAAKRHHADRLTHQVQQNEQGLRAISCLRKLNKVCSDDAFPDELRQPSHECYAYFYDMILTRCKALLEQGDLEMVKRLIRHVPTDGCRA